MLLLIDLCIIFQWKIHIYMSSIMSYVNKLVYNSSNTTKKYLIIYKKI